ncbi:MAG: hypothetical protein QOF09_870, partial [Alphaproteobacteria bacterium]|nr:hypothetical protein [Alphaproteobacteria bacterium]
AGGIKAVPAQDRIHLHTNEAEIGEVLRDGGVTIDDPLAVFGAVLKNLPERVRVYPTENYFYFRFTHNGVVYAGNIRLAAADRDQGKVNFSYNEAPTDWNPDPKSRHVTLGTEQGVTVEKAAPLTYRVTHAAKSVTFVLNDLSGVKPPPDMMRPDETFLGPVFDESGVRFFLVFNSRLKIFHFVLDETTPVADQFATPKAAEPVQIGKRTGFAFYPFESRKILVGVDERQSRLNSYFDGPFDQLPENFIEGEALREAILAAAPGVKGKIDRLGNFTDGSGRYLIHPYLLYRQPGDLALFQRCASSKAVPADRRAACFVIDDDEAQRKNPRPLALKRR